MRFAAVLVWATCGIFPTTSRAPRNSFILSVRPLCSFCYLLSFNDHYYLCTYDFHVGMNHCVSTPKIYELSGVVSWTYQWEDERFGFGMVELYYSQAENIYRIGVRKSTGKAKEVR